MSPATSHSNTDNVGRVAATQGVVPDPQVVLAYSDEDLHYVEMSFRPVTGAAERLIEGGVLPRPTYILPDGTGMVPEDHARLLEDCDGDPAAVAPAFRRRFVAAGGDPDDVEDEYDAWLSGGYGACLQITSPEAIVVKAALMQAIKALRACPRPTERPWREALRGSVDALDAFERSFAQYDRIRFGGLVSRDRLVTATRSLYADVWTP